MRRVIKGALCALATSLVLAAAVGTASASGIQVGSRPTSITATGTLSFMAGVSTLRCPVTLGGVLEPAIRSRAGAPAGLVKSPRVGACSGGTATVLAEPAYWPIKFVSFGGTLPTVSSLVLDASEASLLATALGVGCLFRGALRLATNGPEVTSARAVEATTIPVFARLSPFCVSTATVSGTLAIAPTVRLTGVAALAGNLVATPSPLKLPAEVTTSTLHLTNWGEANVTVETSDVTLSFNAGSGSYSVDAGRCEIIVPNGVCDIDVTIATRPANGTVSIQYLAGGATKTAVADFKTI